MRNEKSMGEVLQDLKLELGDFVRTRLEIFVSEMREKTAAIKLAAPMLVAALLLALGAFGAFTFCLIALVATIVGTSFAWAIGAGCVFLLYLIAGGVFGYLGYREITAQGMAPTRTIKVLKQDQVWIQNEARAA